MAGVPLIIVGQSGENVGMTQLQVWAKVTTSVKNGARRRGLWDEGRWLICVILSALFILENILVSSLLVRAGISK